ncbi:MAG TPA: hypothetical protein VLH56_10530, partial [Dissulfurispiraceae bacterium]|nr:hypothetical protein [Dissulfurispiraceae bacterium]
PQGVEATPPQKQTPLEFAGQVVSELPQNAGVAARGFVKGAMSLPTMIADPLTELWNKIAPPGMEQMLPSEGITTMFRSLGVKEPETRMQEVLEAVTMGLGSSAAGLGTGAALSAPVKLGATFGPSTALAATADPSKIAAIGRNLAFNPVSDLAGSAASMGASKIAEQQGASPLAQAAIGFGAGYGASRLASPAAAIKTAATQAEDEIGDVIRKAAAGDKTAKKTVADLAAINPQAREAARRLEVDLPADVFSDNEQVRRAAGLGRSVAGGIEEATWVGTFKNAVKRFDEVMGDLGATFVEDSPAPAVASERVKDSMLAARKALSDQTSKLYNEIDEAVPKSTPAIFDSTKAKLAEIALEVGEDGMSAQEKRLAEMVADPATTYGRLMREKNLIGQAIAKKDSPYGNMEAGALKRLYGALAEDQLASVEKIGASKIKTLPGTPESFDLPLNPDGTVTLYHGTTAKGKQAILESGVLKADAEPDVYLTTDPLGGGYGDGSVVAVKVKPSLLNMDDEFPDGRVDFRINAKKPGGSFKPSSVGIPEASLPASDLKEKLVAANLMYGQQKELGDKIIGLFGKDIAGSVADKMKMAITSSAKGGTGEFTRLMESVPDDLKKEVTATAIASIARSSGGFGLPQFVKMYQGIRANPKVYKQIVENLGPESDSVLRDLYEISKRLSDSAVNPLTTGKANQALVNGLTAQNLVEKALSSVVGKGAVTAGGAALGSAIGGGPFGASVGAGTSSALVDALSRGEKSKLEAVGKLFRSREFQDLIVNAGKTDTITQAQAKALARSAAFQSFAKAV